MRTKIRKHQVRLPISRTGGPMRDKKKYQRKEKHKRKIYETENWFSDYDPCDGAEPCRM